MTLDTRPSNTRAWLLWSAAASLWSATASAQPATPEAPEAPAPAAPETTAPAEPAAEPAATPAAPAAAEPAAEPSAAPAPEPAAVPMGAPAPTPTPGATGAADTPAAGDGPDAPTAEADAADAGPGVLELHVYADASFAFDDQDDSEPSFSLGDIQLHAGGRIAEGVQLVTSTLLQYQGNDADVELDIAYLQWEIDPGFGLRVGRDRTAIGRYRRAASHRLGELATSTPVLASDEDDGGVLLAHQLGVEVFGSTETAGGHGIHYSLGVGNGRGVTTRVPSGNLDGNDFKSIAARIAVTPGGALEGLDFGVSGYADRIPRGLFDTRGVELIAEEIDELAGAFHVAYITERVDLQGELFYLYHEGRDSEADADLVGGFVQVGVPVQRFTPYGRLEMFDRDFNDIYFNVSNIPFELVDLRIGVGYRIADGAVLKLEYGGELETEVHGGTAQFAFGI